MATGGCPTLSTQDLRRWGCQDGASPCSRLNPGQVLWSSYSRYLGRNAYRGGGDRAVQCKNPPRTPRTPTENALLDARVYDARHLRHPEGDCMLSFALSCRDQEAEVLVL